MKLICDPYHAGVSILSSVSCDVMLVLRKNSANNVQHDHPDMGHSGMFSTSMTTMSVCTLKHLHRPLLWHLNRYTHVIDMWHRSSPKIKSPCFYMCTSNLVVLDISFTSTHNVFIVLRWQNLNYSSSSTDNNTRAWCYPTFECDNLCMGNYRGSRYCSKEVASAHHLQQARVIHNGNIFLLFVLPSATNSSYI